MKKKKKKKQEKKHANQTRNEGMESEEAPQITADHNLASVQHY